MSSLNKVILIGRLTSDPELRYTPSGIAVTKFTLAVNRPFANRDGKYEADFINIVVWQKQAETCANYLGKGRLVAVEGRLQIRSYDDNQGIHRKTAEVVADAVRFLDSAKNEGSNGKKTADTQGDFPSEEDIPPHLRSGGGAQSGGGLPIGEGYAFNEDDVPF